MVCLNEEYKNSTAVVECPAGVPVSVLRLIRFFDGHEACIWITDTDHQLLAIVGDGLTEHLRGVIERAEFLENATQCVQLQNLLGVGYVMCGYSVAQWMTREVRLVLDMAPIVRGMLVKPKLPLEGGVS